MGRAKLTEVQVRHIKQMLRLGDLTHQEIADKINYNMKCNHAKNPERKLRQISRVTISKINVGMKDVNNKDGRWNDIE